MAQAPKCNGCGKAHWSREQCSATVAPRQKSSPKRSATGTRTGVQAAQEQLVEPGSQLQIPKTGKYARQRAYEARNAEQVRAQRADRQRRYRVRHKWGA